MRRLPVVLAVGVSCLLFAQEKVDEATDARMRSEEMEHSQLMHTLHMLDGPVWSARYRRITKRRPDG